MELIKIGTVLSQKPPSSSASFFVLGVSLDCWIYFILHICYAHMYVYIYSICTYKLIKGKKT